MTLKVVEIAQAFSLEQSGIVHFYKVFENILLTIKEPRCFIYKNNEYWLAALYIIFPMLILQPYNAQ